jgi:hypothetical protein
LTGERKQQKIIGGDMKLFGRFLTLVAAAALLVASVAEAQSAPKVIEATIPFDFTVANRVFPAGNYSFVTTVPNFLQLRDSRRHTLLTTLTLPVEATSTLAAPKLHFYTAGSQHFLVGIWQEGNRDNQRLSPSKQDLELARQQNGQMPSSTRAPP